MASLIGFPATLKEVEAVPTPEATKSWLPIPFGDLIGMTKERLAVHEYSILRESYALKRCRNGTDAMQMFGVMDIKSINSNGNHPDWVQALGIRSSHNKTLSNAFCGGATVLVCENLDFIGDFITLRRHTRNSINDLPMLLDDILEKMEEKFKQQENFIEALKGEPVPEWRGHDIMMNVVKKGIFPTSKILKVANAWDVEKGKRSGTRFGYTEHGDTAWDLFNAFTFVNKERSAEYQINDSSLLTGFFEKEFDLAA